MDTRKCLRARFRELSVYFERACLSVSLSAVWVLTSFLLLLFHLPFPLFLSCFLL